MFSMGDVNASGRVIGILALQGDYDAHRKMLDLIDSPSTYVRTADELNAVDALILPGGESTTIIKLMARIGLDAAIAVRAAAGMPMYGTCAGMILMAKDIEGCPDQATLDLMDICVARNAFGRQLDSFEADIPIVLDDDCDTSVIHGVFIRDPYVVRSSSDVQVLSQYQNKIVGVRQLSMLATAFHPELTDDPRIHAYFARMVAASKETR